jgi:creatinine amidohydrolase
MVKDFLDALQVTWGEVQRHDYDVVILPWGSIEPHNYHLPYLTDCYLSYVIALDSANTAFEKAGINSMVLPPIYLGSQNPGQWNLPFCIHTRIETQKAILTDIVDSLHQQNFQKLVIVNGHCGNSFKALIRDMARLYSDFCIVLVDWYDVVPKDGFFEERIDEHAGEQETSVMLHYFPHLVKMEEAGNGNTKPMKLESLKKKIGWMPRNWSEVTVDTGIADELGADASPINDDGNKYERGKKILGELTQTPQPETLSGYSAFAPVIDTFLKEHLFADIFERDVLTYAERELVTVSVISSIGNAEPMLRSHLAICLNVGLIPQQLSEFVDVVQSTIGEKEGKSARLVLEDVLENRKQ